MYVTMFLRRLLKLYRNFDQNYGNELAKTG